MLNQEGNLKRASLAKGNKEQTNKHTNTQTNKQTNKQQQQQQQRAKTEV